MSKETKKFGSYEWYLEAEQKVIRTFLELMKEDLLCAECCNPRYIVIEVGDDESDEHIHIVAGENEVGLNFKNYEQFVKFFNRLDREVQAALRKRKALR